MCSKQNKKNSTLVIDLRAYKFFLHTAIYRIGLKTSTRTQSQLVIQALSKPVILALSKPVILFHDLSRVTESQHNGVSVAQLFPAF